MSLGELFVKFRSQSYPYKVWIRLPTEEKFHLETLDLVGEGGSKCIYSISGVDNLVLILGNTNVENPGGYWGTMAK